MKSRIVLDEQNQTLRQYARDMRKNMTDAEKSLWKILRNKRFIDYKFRRQVPLGPYIADFVCILSRLIIEVDGSQHVDNSYDVKRDLWFQNNGFRVMRFWNIDVLNKKSEVMDAIWFELNHKDI